jgi:hypothetical protein
LNIDDERMEVCGMWPEAISHKTQAERQPRAARPGNRSNEKTTLHVFHPSPVIFRLHQRYSADKHAKLPVAYLLDHIYSLMLNYFTLTAPLLG